MPDHRGRAAGAAAMPGGAPPPPPAFEGNPYRDATLPAMLDAVAARFGEREALVFRERRLRYRDVQREVERLARGLLALGLRPGDKVALWLPNRPEWLVVQHACAQIGAVLVALNPRYRVHELDYILRQSDTTTLVLTDHAGPVDFLEILAGVLPGLPTADPDDLRFAGMPELRRIVCLAEDVYGGTLRYRDVLEAGDDPALAPALAERRGQVGPDDVLTLLYTSGTTSFPKGAMISHRNCLPHGWASGERLGLTAEDRVLHTLPFSGTWGGLVIPLMTLTHGAALVLEEAFDPLETLHLIQAERITVWNAVDAMLVAVLDHPDLDRYARSTLRTGGVAMTGGGRHGLFDEVLSRLGMPGAVQPYGMTEVNALALCPSPDDPVELRRQAGVWPAAGLEVRVVDPASGADRPPGEPGELWLRGPLVTRGYYRKPEETAAAFDPAGWFRTGDLAVQDTAGHTVFLGRLKETLRIGHFMVAPAEIEAFLMREPAIAQAFVVGVPDPRLGEVAVAYVIARVGQRVDPEALQAACRGQLASFKVPRRIWVVDDVPRTPGPHGDKVQKAKLREQALRALGLAPGPTAAGG
jgi:fatty-acyl-CoA synthase